jgi:hypothetical protein
VYIHIIYSIYTAVKPFLIRPIRCDDQCSIGARHQHDEHVGVQIVQFPCREAVFPDLMNGELVYSEGGFPGLDNYRSENPNVRVEG